METFTFLIVFFFSGHIVTSVFDYIKNRRIERIKKEEDKRHRARVRLATTLNRLGIPVAYRAIADMKMSIELERIRKDIRKFRGRRW